MLRNDKYNTVVLYLSFLSVLFSFMKMSLHYILGNHLFDLDDIWMVVFNFKVYPMQ